MLIVCRLRRKGLHINNVMCLWSSDEDEFSRISLRSVNLAISFSCSSIARPSTSSTFFTSSPLSLLSLFDLFLLVRLLRMRHHWRQAVWLVLFSLSLCLSLSLLSSTWYYYIRYKNRRQTAHSARCILPGKELPSTHSISLGQRRLVLLACSILAINFFLLSSSSHLVLLSLPFSRLSLSF